MDTEVVANQISEFVNTKFKIVKRSIHKFKPWGRTFAFILSESHFTAHTYPEHNFLSVDIYICNPDIDMVDVSMQIQMIARPSYCNQTHIKRGVKNS